MASIKYIAKISPIVTSSHPTSFSLRKEKLKSVILEVAKFCKKMAKILLILDQGYIELLNSYCA